MTLWIGRRQSIGIGNESARGEGVAPTYWLNCLSFTFKDVPTRAVSEAGFGGIWGGDQAPMTLNHAEGDFDLEVDDQSFGAILKATLGTVVNTGPTDATAYTHTYTLQNDNEHDSLSITTIDPIGNLLFEMGMINTLELKVEPNAIISSTIGFISKPSQATNAYPPASYGASKKFVGRHLTFKIGALTSNLDAALKLDLKSLTLRIEKNAEPQSVLSTVQPIDIVNKRFNITGEIVMNYEDRAWLGYINDSSYKAIRIDIVHSDTITGAVSTKYQFRLDLSKVEFEAWEPDLSMDNVTTQKLSFTALYDAGANNNVINSCYLINGILTY
jgi:hypothetical protein